MGVCLGDLGLGDLGGIDGDGQWCVDIWRREEGLVFRVEVDWLESGRRLAVGIIYHWVALVVVSCCGVCMMKETVEGRETSRWSSYYYEKTAIKA